MLTKGFHPHVHRRRIRVSRSGEDSTLRPKSSQNGLRGTTGNTPKMRKIRMGSFVDPQMRKTPGTLVAPNDTL